MGRISSVLNRVSKEPPFRLVARAFIKRFSKSVRTRNVWDAAARPNYLAGVLAAADQAKAEGVAEICVYEFGVAGGNGLLALGDIAAEVEAATGIKVQAYGFDTGRGLPELTGDYRDHPDHWQFGDYPMDEDALRGRLRSNTTLVIGNIRDTLPAHLSQATAPIGFAAVDVDTYSSSREVLRMFSASSRRMLRRVFLYFDDVDLMFNHRFAGELLAIEEFNRASPCVKIDRWRNIAALRPFPEAGWLKRMYIAHDLEAISKLNTSRKVKVIKVDDVTGTHD